MSRLHGALERATFDSRCLADNPLGDPTERDVFVYVPRTTRKEKRFPVIVMLPGFAANHVSILSYSPWAENTVEAFDAQIARGESAPAILVLPDCTNRWGGSQFLDSPATGAYQTYLADEVIPFVDERFRTIPRREARAITGRSSGGFGALRLAMDRPDTVAAVAAHAADAAFDVSMRPMLTRAAIALDAAGGAEAFAMALPHGGPRGPMEFDAAFVLAASAAYAPARIEALPFCELPVDPKTGQVREEVFATWRAHDPLTRVPASADALRGLRGLFIDAGNTDDHGLHFAARALRDACAEVGADVRWEEFPGGHRGTSHRYLVSLPYLARLLDAE